MLLKNDSKFCKKLSIKLKKLCSNLKKWQSINKNIGSKNQQKICAKKLPDYKRKKQKTNSKNFAQKNCQQL